MAQFKKSSARKKREAIFKKAKSEQRAPTPTEQAEILNQLDDDDFEAVMSGNEPASRGRIGRIINSAKQLFGRRNEKRRDSSVDDADDALSLEVLDGLADSPDGFEPDVVFTAPDANTPNFFDANGGTASGTLTKQRRRKQQQQASSGNVSVREVDDLEFPNVQQPSGFAGTGGGSSGEDELKRLIEEVPDRVFEKLVEESSG